MELGQHAAFIWAAYGVVVLVLGVLIAWLIADGNRLQQRLDALEARGVRRRPPTAPAGRDAAST